MSDRPSNNPWFRLQCLAEHVASLGPLHVGAILEWAISQFDCSPQQIRNDLDTLCRAGAIEKQDVAVDYEISKELSIGPKYPECIKLYEYMYTKTSAPSASTIEILASHIRW